MYPEWISLDNDLLWGALLLVGHLITTVLALAIFSSIFRKNMKKGYLFLGILILIGIMNIYNVFNYSITVGYMLCLMYLTLSVITYFSLKNKISDA
ncbi:hypothetical protein [Bacillus sp. PS06]|uniref:hypothetical protein n=1 Tax=Bacillus sp. PS06 TaxID=2764176 RepID=UPI00177E25ED|nr:hypothetical protein [Bacillus sp. PS06]MBD8070086.1 hypothetical protein [Bacillus sp. PS06]